MLLTEGQISDHRGARVMLTALPDADTLIAVRGYDNDWYREALTDKDITPCIPDRMNRKADLDAGLTRIIDAHYAHPFTRIWDDIGTSSSDGSSSHLDADLARSTPDTTPIQA